MTTEKKGIRPSSWEVRLLNLIPPDRVRLANIKPLLIRRPENVDQLLQFIKRVTAWRLIKPNTSKGLTRNELAVIIRNKLYFFGFHELRNICLSIKIPVIEPDMFNQKLNSIINSPDFSVQQISPDHLIYDGNEYTVTHDQPFANFYAFYMLYGSLYRDFCPDRNDTYHIMRLRTQQKPLGYKLQYHEYCRIFPKTRLPITVSLERPEIESIPCLWARKKISKYGWRDLLDYCYRKNKPEKILICRTTPNNFTMFISLHKYFPTCLIKMIDLFLGDDISPFQLPDYFEKT